jgi:hypothetical protein
MASTSIDEAREIADDAWEHRREIEEIIEDLTLNGLYMPNGQTWTVDAVEELIDDPKRRRFASEGMD